MGRFIFVSFSLLVVFLSLIGTGAGQPCPPGWSSFNQSCYQVANQRMTWAAAEMSCRREAEGSHLASIQSLAESDYVSRLVSNRTQPSLLSGDVWIGLNYTRKNGNWQWTDGSPFGYQSWNQEPNDFFLRKSCVELLRSTGYLRWNNQPCWVLRYFICKLPLLPEGSR
nr:C-type lectin 6 [Tropidolaemus subannulatus]